MMKKLLIVLLLALSMVSCGDKSRDSLRNPPTEPLPTMAPPAIIYKSC